ncbi:MAG: hypothetical protein CMJ58_02600 [Planctomycetaceae bacterium]|nr:hypothetical protein [Planctomycetaceae bacterium]
METRPESVISLVLLLGGVVALLAAAKLMLQYGVGRFAVAGVVVAAMAAILVANLRQDFHRGDRFATAHGQFIVDRYAEDGPIGRFASPPQADWQPIGQVPVTTGTRVVRHHRVTWIVLMPLIGIAAWALLRRRRRDERQQRSGLGLAVLGTSLCVGGAAFFVSSGSHQEAIVESTNVAPIAVPAPAPRSADEIYDQLTSPRIELDEQSAPVQMTPDGTRFRAVQVSPEYAELIGEVLDAYNAGESGGESAGDDADGVAEDAAAADAEGEDAKPSSVAQMGRLAKDAVVIMWLGDPQPLAALREPREQAEPPSTASLASADPAVTGVTSVAGHTPAEADDRWTPRERPLDLQPLPAWVSESYAGDDERLLLTSDPFSTERQCRLSLEAELGVIVHDRIEQLITDTFGTRTYVPPIEALGLSPKQLMRLLGEKTHQETLATSVGAMKRSHVLVHFTSSADELLLNAWRDYALTDRIIATGALASGVVGLVALAFGLVKLDTWTRGYYTKRLFLGVPAAIIGLVCLLAMVS